MVAIKDFGIGKLREDIKAMGRSHVLTGVLGDRAKAQHPKAGTTVGQVAAWLEYGTEPHGDHPGQPERPFLRRMVQEQGPRLRKRARRIVADLIDGRASSAQEALELLAKDAEEATAESFDTMNAWAAPLADATVRRKGHDTIGLDTRTVRQAIAAEVRDKEIG